MLMCAPCVDWAECKAIMLQSCDLMYWRPTKWISASLALDSRGIAPSRVFVCCILSRPQTYVQATRVLFCKSIRSPSASTHHHSASAGRPSRLSRYALTLQSDYLLMCHSGTLLKMSTLQEEDSGVLRTCTRTSPKALWPSLMTHFLLAKAMFVPQSGLQITNRKLLTPS